MWTNSSHSTATFSNGQWRSSFDSHDSRIGMRFLFVMKLSRFMVKPNSSRAPSDSENWFKALILEIRVFIPSAILTIPLQADKHSSITARQAGSEILSLPSLLKKSSLRPEQILQALLEMTELILATHFCWFLILDFTMLFI